MTNLPPLLRLVHVWLTSLRHHRPRLPQLQSLPDNHPQGLVHVSDKELNNIGSMRLMSMRRYRLIECTVACQQVLLIRGQVCPGLARVARLPVDRIGSDTVTKHTRFLKWSSLLTIAMSGTCLRARHRPVRTLLV
jgi:hypothetical protein